MSVNKCADRLWTAESDALYSTIDILLAETVPETGSPNQLYNELGSNVCHQHNSSDFDMQIINALNDIFICFEGPRVRDQISHGVADVKTLTSPIVQRVWSVCIVLCYKYHPQRNIMSS